MFDIALKLDSTLDDGAPDELGNQEAETSHIFYDMNLPDNQGQISGGQSENEPSTFVVEADAQDRDLSDDGSVLAISAPIPPKRVVFSARESPKALQIAGIRHLQEDIDDNKIGSDPKVFGFGSHYIFHHVWGATSARHHQQVGSSSTPASVDSSSPSTFKNVFKITEKKKGAPVKAIGVDLSKYSYQVRTSDKAIWPQSNEKKVASVKSARQMVTSRPIVGWLRDDGIIPIITHPITKDSTIRVAFGPYLDPHNQPHAPGSCFRAAGVYLDFGMRLHADHNEAWRSNPDTTSALFVRLPEKNSLPMTLPKNKRKSPLAELERIIALGEREGFDLYRSGGNPVVKGNAPPGPGTKSAGEGAFFEHEQSIKNPYNLALENVAESGRPVVVFGAGLLFPKEFHDEDLKKETDGAEQAFYFGTYTVLALGERPALNWDEIRAIYDEYLPTYKNLAVCNLRFLLVPHRAYRLIPVEYPPIVGGYKHLSIDARDNRRPTFDLPAKVSFQKAFEIDTTVSFDEQSPPFDETTMFKKWYDSGGYYEFVSVPFVPGSRKTVPKSMTVDWEFEDDPSSLRNVETPFSPLAIKPDAPKLLVAMEAKSNTIEENFWMVMVCSIASFCRELEINVDINGHIGPLMDADPSFHQANGDSHLANYHDVFGPDIIKSPYLQLLGLEIQRSPLTHPVRVYDANRRYLLESTGGGSLRAKRKGLLYIRSHFVEACDLLFHSFLVEVVRVPILVEWSIYKHKNTDGFHLPVIVEVDAFLGFLDSIRFERRFSTMSNILQTQYELHQAFNKSRAFNRAMKFVAENLGVWLQESVEMSSSHGSGDETTDLFFDSCITSLSSFLGQSEALGTNGDLKLPFFCQHVLSNMNELVSEWPLGNPNKAISGFGGSFGVRRLQCGMKEKRSMEEVLALMVESVQRQKDIDLSLVGLMKDTTGVVVVIENGRPVTCLDAEHWCCIMFQITERKVGGTRGLGNSYQVTSTHCQPVRTLQLPNETAKEAVKEYRHLVDSGEWQIMGARAIAGRDTVSVPQVVDGIDRHGEEGTHSHCDESEKKKERKKRRKQNRNESSVSLLALHNTTPCNVMLGMIFGAYVGSPEEIANAKEGTAQLRRDTARCVASEIYAEKDVYTVDNRDGTDFPSRTARHIVQSLFKIDLTDDLMIAIKGRVSQICLDYFWFQGAYWGDKLQDSFFSLSLPRLCELLLVDGSIYLALSVHITLGVLRHYSCLERLFDMSLVHSEEVQEIDLLSGSLQISEELYANFQKLGAKDRQSYEQLGTCLFEIRQHYEGDVSDEFTKLAGEKNPKECRFIKLRKLK